MAMGQLEFHGTTASHPKAIRTPLGWQAVAYGTSAGCPVDIWMALGRNKPTFGSECELEATNCHEVTSYICPECGLQSTQDL